MELISRLIPTRGWLGDSAFPKLHVCTKPESRVQGQVQRSHSFSSHKAPGVSELSRWLSLEAVRVMSFTPGTVPHCGETGF